MTALPRLSQRINVLPAPQSAASPWPTASPWPLVLGVAYVAAIAWGGGIRPVHGIAASLAILEYINEHTRRFLRLFFPFLLVGISYDSMRYYYWAGIAGHIHVAEPYWRDLRWFGIPTAVSGGVAVLTPNEYWARHPLVVLDFFCGLSYLTFVAQYVATMVFLFWKNYVTVLRRLSWTFLVVNLMGFATYFIYPAAPPWYVERYGLGPALMNAQPTPAGAARFDALFGTHFFDTMYSNGIDVYGAYPSLHVTYPFLVAWTTFQVASLRRWRTPACAFYGLMCLSAVYLQHHYVVDIVLGTLYAVVALVGVKWIAPRSLCPRRNDLPSASSKLSVSTQSG